VQKENILKALKVDTLAGALVKLGYGDLFDLSVRSLDFRTGHLGQDDAASAIRIVDSYNEFVGEDVATAVENLFADGHTRRVQFGREGSPVLYLSLTDDGDSEEVMEAMSELKADEIDAQPGDVIRAWWD